MDNDRFALFEGLLGEAFARLGQATPTVVSVKPPEENGETSASFAIPFSWPNRIVASPDDIGPAVSDLLAAGPVLLVPPWARRQGRRHPLSREEHEIAVLNCAPEGPDSLLAVLTPAAMWTLRSPQKVREELAKRWKPVLLVYAAGVLPGVHSYFLLTVTFLRPLEAEDSLLRVFRVLPRQDDAEITGDFRRLLRQIGGSTQFGYVLRDLPQCPGV